MPTDVTLFFPPFELDLAAEQLRRGPAAIPLRRKSFAMLRHLAERPGRLVTRRELLAAVWPDVHVGDGLPRDSLLEIRRALGDDPRAPRFVETVRGRGYRFVPPVSRGLRGTARATDPPPGLVGREAELERLDAYLARALGGERQVVFVSGEAGIGKTTLVDAFRRRIAGDGVWDAQGQCIEHFGTGEAYMPVLEALVRLCRAPGGTALVSALRERAPSWLAQMPGVAGADELGAASSAAETTRERMLRELGDALDALTAERALVLTLEDLHWSDPSTLALLSALARRREQARLLVLATYRPADRLANGHPLRALVQELRLHRHCEELRLPFLREVEVTRYVAWRFGAADRPWARAVGRVVHRRTEGNPLFMVNVIEDLIARGTLARVGERWELTDAADGLALGAPADVEQLIDRQLDQLAADDQELLEAASIAGFEFSAAAVAAALDADVARVEAQCAALGRREQFLAPAGTAAWPDGTTAARYRFVHTLHREVVYGRIPAGRRTELHRRIGAREEAGHGPRAREIAAELAVHFERGGDGERALAYRRHAGDNALGRHAYREAVDHYTSAIAALHALPPTPERDREEFALQLGLAMPLVATRSEASPEVERALRRAHELSERAGDAFQLPLALLGQWGLRFARGDLAGARAIATHLLRLGERTDEPALLSGAHLSLGLTATYEGAVDAAEEHLARASVRDDAGRRPDRTLFDRAGIIDPRVTCAAYGAIVACMQGRLARAVERIEEADRLARETASTYALVTATGFAAMVHESRRDVAAVRERASAALAIASEHGFPQWVGLAMVLRGWAEVAAGGGDGGLDEMREGLAAWERTGTAIGRTYLLALLADGYARAERIDEGLDTIVQGMATLEESGERLVEPELHRLRGELLARRHGADRGVPEHCFAEAMATARRRGAKLLELRAATSLARSWMARGRRGDARRVLAAVCRSFPDPDGVDVATARAVLAQASVRPKRG